MMKDNEEKLELTYVSSSVAETIVYEKGESGWSYSETKTTELGGGGGKLYQHNISYQGNSLSFVSADPTPNSLEKIVSIVKVGGWQNKNVVLAQSVKLVSIPLNSCYFEYAFQIVEDALTFQTQVQVDDFYNVITSGTDTITEL